MQSSSTSQHCADTRLGASHPRSFQRALTNAKLPEGEAGQTQAGGESPKEDLGKASHVLLSAAVPNTPLPRSRKTSQPSDHQDGSIGPADDEKRGNCIAQSFADWCEGMCKADGTRQRRTTQQSRVSAEHDKPQEMSVRLSAHVLPAQKRYALSN